MRKCGGKYIPDRGTEDPDRKERGLFKEVKLRPLWWKQSDRRVAEDVGDVGRVMSCRLL